MNLDDIKNNIIIFKEESSILPNKFITNQARIEGEWDGSVYLNNLLKEYELGNYGWLKGGQNHVVDKWISWPLIWNFKVIYGNSKFCPKTVEILSKIPLIKVAGFSLMKPEVKLNKHVDFVGSGYLATYHLGLNCPEGCYLHHSEIGDIEEKNGKVIIMDARKEHWAENLSKEDRIILYIEFYDI